MIKKTTSTDLMNILEESQQSFSDLETNINNLQKELERKIVIVKNIQEYNNSELLNIKEILLNNKLNNDIDNTIVLSNTQIESGIYDVYGTTVHSAFLKTPYDIFNFGSVTGKIFKDNANVKINNIVKEEYTNILMSDENINKQFVFEEYDTPDVKIEIEINPEDLLGSTGFNAIEFLPFIPGSFSINKIEIYTMQDYQNNNTTIPSFTMTNNLQNIGANRLLMDKTRDLWKIVFNIYVNYKNLNGMYPFGLKHLYFLKGNFNPNSNVIFKVTKDNYIDTISEDIIMHDQNGKYETTCTEQGIKLYMSYMSGVLDYKIETSQGLTQNPINRNIKEFYVSMPILKSINSITFKSITTR